MSTEDNAPENNDADNWPPALTEEWWRQQQAVWSQRAAEKQTKSVTTLKAAIPFLAQLGITKITLHYDGYGDSGAIEDFVIEGAETAPKTRETLDQALKMFPPETNAQEKFCSQALEESVYELLPTGFEINEGSYGDVIIDCEANKIMRQHSERVIETNYSEDEW